MDLTLILTIAGILLSILIPLAGYFYKKKKEFRNYYSLVWKSVSRLKPRDFLGERPYNDIYIERDVDKCLLNVIESGSNALIVGPPLSGKTRAVYNSLKKSGKNFDILATRNISMSSIEIPADRKFWRKKIIVIDDFQNFIERQDNYHLFLKNAKEKNIAVISTCHSGREYRKAKNKLLEQNIDIEIIFNNIFEIDKVSVVEGKSIADRLGAQWDNIKFNGTIGSIFMKLSEMERRYDQCDTVEKTILRSLRNLYISGVSEDTCTFRLEWIKKVASGYELSGKDFEWVGWLKNLEDKEFLMLISRNKVLAEDAYLEYVIKPETNTTYIELFEGMIEIFKDDTNVLMMIGERIYDSGTTSIDISNHMKLAISAFERVLKRVQREDNESIYFKANNYLGMSYWSLSKIEDIVNNCEKSILYYNNILQHISINSKPLEYAIAKNKIGNTFTILAETKSKTAYIGMAIDSFKEALKVYSAKNYPREYAQTSNNLGAAYLVLSDVENGRENLLTAAKYFEESLKIRTLGEDSKGYAFTKNNLANTFARLSQLEEAEKNLFLALESYSDTLKIYRKEKFPHQYAMTMNNIGNVYCLLSNVKDKKQNALNALRSYEKALEIRTIENAPVQYSKTMFNLGDVYMILNEAEERTDYLYKAIDCLERALDPDLSSIEPHRQGEIHNLLGKAFMLLGEKEDKEENYNKGVEAFSKALEVFPEKENPEIYKSIQEERILAEKKIKS